VKLKIAKTNFGNCEDNLTICLAQGARNYASRLEV